MSEKLQAIRGMEDVLPDASPLWEKLEDACRDVFRQYTGRVDDQAERLMTLRGLFRFADGVRQPQGLAPGAPVLEPGTGGGEGLEELALAQADHELTAAGLERRRVAAWETTTIGPFTITALPAAVRVTAGRTSQTFSFSMAIHSGEM